MKVKEILNVRRYKAGYEIREELIDDSEYGGEGVVTKRAYTPDGHYIGDSKQGYRLCKKCGIKPELAFPNNTVCSIGFCEKEQKWYGWSHRAIYGFGAGDSIVKGDCAYTSSNPDELIRELRGQYSGEYYNNVNFEVNQNKVIVTYDKGNIENNDPQSEAYPLGRGEWMAHTLVDARWMAIDFACGVG